MLSQNGSESKVAVYEKTRLREAWGDRIDPNEFMRDTNDHFGATVYNAYTSLYDRTDGRYRPVYQNEMDLRRVRAMAWFIYETVPAAAAWANRLLDYTIGTGFDWSVKAADKSNSPLARAAKAWLDRVLENSQWSSQLERESFIREVVDGEFLTSIDSSMGSVALHCHEPDELTEPAYFHELNAWLEIEDFVPSWTFGVLTRQNRPANHLGFHLVHDITGDDWDFYRPAKFEFWKRNSRANAKRGFSDFHRAFLHIARSDLVLTNTAEGAANQAAIAYIVEHAETSSATDVERFALANSYQSRTVDPLTRQTSVRKRLRSGTRLDVRGAKFHAGLLGSNNSEIYIQVIEASLRIAGTVHAFPEGMLTGSYANNNFASSLTAESPFVQGRMADQASRAQRVRSMFQKILCCGCELGVFRSLGVTSPDELLAALDILVIPSKIVHRDPLEMTKALVMQEDQGYVSRLTAMNELGRDPEVEIANGAKRKDEGGSGAPGGPAGGPGGGVGPAGGEPDPTSPPASWANLSRMQLVRNMRAYKDVIAGLKSGELSSVEARAMLAQIGFDKANIDLIIRDMRDGVQDFPLKESAGRRRRGRVSEADPGPGCGSRSARLLASRYRKYLQRRKRRVREAFDPSQPRGEDGKWIWSGVSFKGMDKSDTYVQLAIKVVKGMEQLAGQGKWDLLEKSQHWKNQVGSDLMAQAKANLLKLKPVEKVPSGAKVSSESPALGGWKKVGGQLGTEKGGTFVGPDGKKYYVKTPDNPARAYNEVLAAKLYSAAGANVVQADLIEVDGSPAVATLWADDAKKINWNDPAARVEAHEDFAVHAWLANWDAVGAGSENPMDNIKTIGGKPTLVDAGGSLEYSGMGGSGKKPFGPEPMELVTLKDPSVNATMAKVFGDMTPAEELASYKKVLAVQPEQIDALVAKYHYGSKEEAAAMAQTLKARREYIQLRAEELADHFGLDSKPVAVAGPLTAEKLGPSALPAPPVIKSPTNQHFNPKFQALYDMASAGDVAGVEAFKTNATAKGAYTKKLHAYKEQLLASLSVGGKAPAVPPVASPAAAPAPVVPAAAEVFAASAKKAPLVVKLDDADLPVMPTFQTSNEAQLKANNNMLNKAAFFAKRGEWGAVAKLADEAKSPKVKGYIGSLLSKYEEKGGTPLVTASGVDSSKLKGLKAIPVGASVGYWTKMSGPTGNTELLKDVTLKHVKDEKWKVGSIRWKELAADSPYAKKVIEDYTGGGYAYINDNLRNGVTIPNHEGMKKAWEHISAPVPEGLVVSRTHGDQNGNLKLEDFQALAGSVVSDAGYLSTSAGVVVFDYNEVHWKIKVGKGVRGAFVRTFGLPHENEVILDKNQPLRVLGARMADYKGTMKIEVHAETV